MASDLPELTSIRLGRSALECADDTATELIMRSERGGVM